VGILNVPNYSDGEFSSTPLIDNDGYLFDNRVKTSVGEFMDSNYSNNVSPHTHTISELNGLLPISMVLATGSPSSNTYLRGDGSWNTVSTVSTGNLSANPSSVISITNGTSAVVGVGTGITFSQSTSSTNGYVTSSDWNTFNNKSNIIHYHTGEQITSGNVSNDRLVAQGTFTSSAVDYISNVGLLMHFDGVHGSTTFTDIKGNIFTNDGNNNTYISSASYKFGGSSVYINNATIGCDTNIPLLNVGTSAFTLEFWFKKSAGCGSYAGLFSNGSAYPLDIVGVSLTPSSGIQFFYNNNIIYSNTKIFTTAVWYHFALTRKGTTLYMFINGVLDCTAINISAPINFSYQPLMGYNFVQGSGNAFVGFLDELRFTAGVCRYDNSFITQSEAFPSPGIEYLPLLQSVQLNTNGKFGGNYDLMWNNTTKRLFSTSGYDTSGSYNVNGVPHTHNGTYITITSASSFATSAHNHSQYTLSASTSAYIPYSTSGTFSLSGHTHTLNDLVSTVLGSTISISTSAMFFTVNNNNVATLTSAGDVIINSLSGVGNRPVYADSTGRLYC